MPNRTTFRLEGLIELNEKKPTFGHEGCVAIGQKEKDKAPTVIVRIGPWLVIDRREIFSGGCPTMALAYVISVSEPYDRTEPLARIRW